MRTESSTAKRLLKLITGISVMTLCAAPSLFAAEQLPDFSRPTLTPASQTAANFNSKAPNALASYYTYIPLSHADAVTMGFPAACGNKTAASNPFTGAVIHTPTAADLASTADCYIISLRQFSQPTSLEFLKFVLPSWKFILANGGPGTIGANLFPGEGLVDDAGVPFVRQDTFANFAADSQVIGNPNGGKMTWAQGYGSGGAGWQPHGPGTPAVRGCAPWAFQDTPFNALFGVQPTGDQNVALSGDSGTGLWHFPAPTIKGTIGRPVYVQWLNDLKNVWLEGFDPSNDCGHIPDSCYPYNREVVHVHGAHVGPESDGLAVAWYTPNYATFGEGNFTMANYPWGVPNGTDPLAGQYIYYYPMDTEASTIWYHTHAVGITHQNTNAGQAGFFPLTDAHEQALIAGGTLPNPAAFEHGFAFQERNFDTNAQMRMPDVARYDRTSPGCTLDANGLPDPATCTRLNWMYRLGTTQPGIVDPTPALHLVPYVVGAPELTAVSENNRPGCQVDTKNRFKDIKLDGTPFIQCAPFPATETTLEYFGNIAVVNGVVNANYDLQTGQVHRMRFIGGTDSRTWVLQLVKTAGPAGPVYDPTGVPNANGFITYNPAAVIPFWQIGSEQGLLNAPVQRNFIDLMSGERVDVLVDLTGIPAGTTVMLKNLSDDVPYSGIFDLNAGLIPTSVNIPEVMKFNVVADATGLTPSTAPAAITALRTPIAPLAAAAGAPVKNLALIEITDQYGNTMPTVDARGYIPPGMMITEYMLQGSTEQWDIVNTTVDAHPMHLHQVAFQTLSRAPITSFNPPESNTITKVFSQSSYTAGPDVVDPTLSMTTGVSPWEQGWKDTIQSIPGYVQRVVATWDFAGEYVWHCHILSHEEHDMMRPMSIITPSAVAPPAWLGATANNGQGTIKLNWPAVAGASGYIIHESTDGFATSKYAVTTGPVTTATLKLKADGTYKYRIAAIMPRLTATDHPKQTAFTTMAGTVTLAKTVAAPAWVGVQQGKTGGDLKIWWAKSATPSVLESTEGNLHYPVQYLVKYTITATPTVGAAIVVTTDANGAPITGTTQTINVPAGTYTVTVSASLASWKPSAATASAPISINQLVLPAPAYLGAQKNAAGTYIKLWWPTLAGAVLEIKQNGVVIAPVITTVGAYDQAIITLPAGTYTFTIQNIGPVGGIDLPSAIRTSATVTL